MPDIAMCSTLECSKKDTCYRHKAIPNPWRQSYFGEADKSIEAGCEDYINTHPERLEAIDGLHCALKFARSNNMIHMPEDQDCKILFYANMSRADIPLERIQEGVKRVEKEQGGLAEKSWDKAVETSEC